MGPQKNKLHSDYKILRNRITGLIKRSKKNHYQNYFTQNSKDIKKTWTGIKNVINLKSCGKNQTNSMCINKKMESEPTKIAEGFNSFFSSIGLDLQSKISTINADYSKYLTNPIDANFLFRSADTEEILRVIFSFQNSKASGPNSIPTEILKMLSFNLCHPLKEIINI